MFIQAEVKRKMGAQGGKVFAIDKGHSMGLVAEIRAQKKLVRMRRYGSRKVKVAVRRAVALVPSAALTTVRAAVVRHR
jgi:hypothetical protein